MHRTASKLYSILKLLLYRKLPAEYLKKIVSSSLALSSVFDILLIYFLEKLQTFLTQYDVA